MSRVEAKRDRVALVVGAVASLALHGSLGVAWLLQRSTATVPEPPAFNLALVKPPRVTSEPERETPSRFADASPRRTPRTPIVASSEASASDLNGPAPKADGVAPPSPTPGTLAPSPRPMLGLGRALAARGGCLEVERLDADQRRACEDRLATAPPAKLPEGNPYVLVDEHAAVMARVRRQENRGRFSCDLMRNLDPTCPNALPDNQPQDYERPKPPPNKN